MPPSYQFDMMRSSFGGAGTSRYQGNAGGGYQGHHCQQEPGTDVEPVGSYLVNERNNLTQYKLDPMLEEAIMDTRFGQRPPMLSQRSVEPTVTEQAPAVPDLLVWEGVSDLPAVSAMEQNNVPLMQAAILDGEAAASASPPVLSKQDNLLDLLTSPGSIEPMFGRMFDLNQECESMEEPLISTEQFVQDTTNIYAVDDGKVDRTILGQADGRLNKQGKDQTASRLGGRGTVRLTVPVKKSLLCTPALKTKTPQCKKLPGSEVVAKGQQNKKCTRTASSTIDEKATTLLMKSSGIISDNEPITESAHLHFGNQFVAPMKEKLIGDMRVTFRMTDNDGPDLFSTLVGDAEGEDA
ncbi:unnamed protein product [Urochloa humidicola]